MHPNTINEYYYTQRNKTEFNSHCYLNFDEFFSETIYSITFDLVMLLLS